MFTGTSYCLSGGRQLPNFYHPPTVNTLASSLFRPRRDTSVFGGVFLLAAGNVAASFPPSHKPLV